MSTRRNFLKTLAVSAFGLFGLSKVKAKEDNPLILGVVRGEDIYVGEDGKCVRKIKGGCYLSRRVGQNESIRYFNEWFHRMGLHVVPCGYKRNMIAITSDAYVKRVCFEIVDVEV